MILRRRSRSCLLVGAMTLTAGLAAIGCQGNADPDTGSSSARPTADLRVPHASGVGQRLPVTAHATVQDLTLELEVARTREQQATGLMFRRSLADDRGMLFPFDPAQRVSFWMKNVPIPLDMIFVRRGEIIDVQRALPCLAAPCVLHDSGEAVDQVIEVRAGRAAELGLRNGARIDVEVASR